MGEQTIKIEKSHFEEVYFFWNQYLWPNRQSAIEKISAIDCDGKINVIIMSSVSSFYKATDNSGKVIGVISCFSTDLIRFRSRGLWVDNHHRNNGIGLKLIFFGIKRSYFFTSGNVLSIFSLKSTLSKI